MINPLNFHDYEKENMEPYTSDFLNQITSDFTNNMVKLYSEFKSLINEHNNFNTAVNIGLDWLTALAGSLSLSDYYAITGYGDPTSSTDITLQKLFGQYFIENFNKESKIGRYVDDQGKNRAYVANKIYKYISGVWTEDSQMKQIIDNQEGIWQEERADSELYISVVISSSSIEQKAHIIEVVPFAGTEIKKIEWKTPSGSFEQVLPNSKFPVQIVGDIDFTNELRVLMAGAPKGPNYYYSLRYVDVYTSNFKDEGTATYRIGDTGDPNSYMVDKPMNIISDIEPNSDYIAEDLKVKSPLRIQVIKDSIVVYDTKDDPFPLEASIDLTGFTTVDIKTFLYKTDGVTPVIKYIDIK